MAKFVWWMDDARVEQIPSNKVREVAYLMSDYFIANEIAMTELKEEIAKIIGDPK